MKKALPVLLGAVLGVVMLVGLRALADYDNVPTALQAPTWAYGAGAIRTPGIQTTGSPGEVHWTLSAKGKCVDISCNADAAYMFSVSTAAVTLAATTTGNDLPAKAVLTRCLPLYDYVSIYGTAAACKVSEHVGPP